MALRLAGERYPSEGIFDTVTITDGAGHYLQVPKLTTAQRDALSPVNGMIIYNTTTGHFEGYEVDWDALGITDHGELGGLGDDDHTQYVLRNILTTKGDLFMRGASEIERLGIGTNRFFPRVNEAGDGLEYAKGYEFGKDMRRWQNELAWFDWTTTVTGSGSIDRKNYGGFRINTGTTASSTARGYGWYWNWPTYGSSDFEWFAYFIARNITTNGKIWLKIDGDTAADPTDKALGWRLDNDALKGIVHDGTSLTVVDLNTTLAINDPRLLFLKFIHNDKIEWYVNGDKKGESTNIPTATFQGFGYLVFAAANNGDSAQVRADLEVHAWVRD